MRYTEEIMKYTKVIIVMLLCIGFVLGSVSVTVGQGAPPSGGVNFEKLGLLDWYVANQSGAGFSISNPHDMAFDGASMWVSAVGAVVKLQAADGACIAPCKFTVPGYNWGVAFDGANIWVVNSGGTVSKLQASDGSVLKTIALGASDFPPIAFDGTNVWVGAPQQIVTRLRASDGAVLTTTTLDKEPQSIAFDGANAWVAGQGHVYKLSASDGSIVRTIDLGVHTSNYAMAFDGANIWVSSGDSGQNGRVFKIRTSDGANLGSAQVGQFPIGVAFDGANIWVGACDSHSLTKVQPSNFATRTFSALGCPIGLAFDGANIWVANVNGGVGKF